MTTTINTTDTTAITTYYRNIDIWEAVVGSGFANTNYWISNVELNTWENPCDITLTHDTKEGGYKTTTLSPSQLYSAFAKLVIEKTTHCSGYAINDLENADSCFADLVVQTAIFDEIVFG